ncbi:beta-1,6-N-acetylglucosaminyltransferase [Pediococcus inopinatus]|uniref:beta-1,6-N-acetylglucosaminyltransferase n=1 Tax=Pediococcus inopinatus TaxID=114090 RepID=UPI002B2597E7|nr:beta-1,6-N-acetylglucosaminyltransferase [Pediococcus inopinatus]WPC18762.1 beta-1,6-N-acetylglucosaminyltransferase [Pediococcus inopinatus]
MKTGNERHAVLIMSASLNSQLYRLIDAMTYKDNDIFLHLDKKAPCPSYEELLDLKNKGVRFFQAIEVNWAGYSLVKAELFLLEKVVKSDVNYKYIHLLSESDLPIASNKRIHEYLKNRTEEFVEIQEVNEEQSLRRVRYYYPLQELIGKKHNFLWAVQKAFVLLERMFHINRITMESKSIAKGSNWFSITEDFATFVLEQSDWIEKVCHKGQAVDELFIQTILVNSAFSTRRSNNEEGSLRYIVWENKNSPRILRSKQDFDGIENSGKLFARKFDENRSNNIMMKILAKIKKG